MEIKFGDIKISVPYEKYLMKYNMKNPFDTMFPKYSQESFDTFFSRANKDYANFLAEYKKRMEKFMQMSKPEKSEE